MGARRAIDHEDKGSKGVILVSQTRFYSLLSLEGKGTSLIEF
jgi:hypothetical protein